MLHAATFFIIFIIFFLSFPATQLLDSFNLPKLCYDEKQKSFKM